MIPGGDISPISATASAQWLGIEVPCFAVVVMAGYHLPAIQHVGKFDAHACLRTICFMLPKVCW